MAPKYDSLLYVLVRAWPLGWLGGRLVPMIPPMSVTKRGSPTFERPCRSD